jgi:hypothetical protein
MHLKSRTALLTAALTGAGFYALVPSFAQQATPEPVTTADSNAATMAEPDCPFFGVERERFLPRSRKIASGAGNATRQFYAGGGNRAPQPRVESFDLSKSGRGGVIDGPVWAALQAAGITPAQQTTDYEFVRRVSLDVTGRIPSADRVAQFVASADPNKRPAYIDELLASSAYVDKWTMFFGDLYKNTASTVSVRIQAEGRNAFYKWIHDSIAAGKPYNQMASELIAARGNNNFDQTNGQVNFLALGVVTGGPAQDIMDQQTANVATTFLGMSNLNCLLCHNGKGHLDTLNLWGSQTTRVQAWGMAAFMAHTWPRTLTLPVDPAATNPAKYNYWSLDKYTSDYNLNTTTGNRPARQPIGSVKSITPSFIFGNGAPAQGEDYRDALARYVTADPQFARAAVNYIWAQLFGRGIVDPPDQFDPLRLDPNHPPPAPWTLQPSNPDLLNGLAQQFISSGYNVKALIRTIVNSDTYQLSSAYDNTWQDSWEPYFARKLVRRLWSEEIHDAVVTAINTLPLYTVPNFSSDSTVYGATSPGFGKISFAMQAPDVVNMPDGGGASSQFEDNFLRGNRDDAPRKSEGSVLQALALMNDPFVVNRIHATGTGAAASFLQQLLTNYTDSQLVNVLYAKVLSRPPSDSETQTALAALSKGGSTARKANAEDLLWTLFNKLDFVFNY